MAKNFIQLKSMMKWKEFNSLLKMTWTNFKLCLKGEVIQKLKNGSKFWKLFNKGIGTEINKKWGIEINIKSIT